ncbi:MAG: hypothetical protein ACTSUE_00200 [Promethearchaeota archaeon]
MVWKLYSIKMKVKSPIHVGSYKIPHLNPTRMYIPGKLVWGSLTASITRFLGSNDYKGIGDFLEKAIKFGYYYITTTPSNDEHLYLLKYTGNGLCYGTLPEITFKNCMIKSQASTAIDPSSHTAEDEMLHEIEFINHMIEDGNGNPLQIYLQGLIWINEGVTGKYSLKVNGAGDLMLTGNGTTLEIQDDLKNVLQVGGERKYGFGLVELERFNELKTDNLEPFPGEWKCVGEEVIISLEKGDAIWSHVEHNDTLKIKGDVEPIVSRNWGKKGAGRTIENHGFHWVPGSRLEEDREFKVSPHGGWIPI